MMIRFWWKVSAFGRRCLLALVHVNDPWDSQQLDLERPALRRMIARAVWENRHEQRGARIVRGVAAMRRAAFWEAIAAKTKRRPDNVARFERQSAR